MGWASSWNVSFNESLWKPLENGYLKGGEGDGRQHYDEGCKDER
jgi:hypothetical protein